MALRSSRLSPKTHRISSVIHHLHKAQGRFDLNYSRLDQINFYLQRQQFFKIKDYSRFAVNISCYKIPLISPWRNGMFIFIIILLLFYLTLWEIGADDSHFRLQSVGR
ncbi:hypothetical protein NL108_016264 [Boleophthalmus pectinirostris]|nr:hypothetical protein NL108_016264 [Boleophthalmus pectinirostris]